MESLSHLLFLLQAGQPESVAEAAAVPEVTPGQSAAGILVLLMIIFSFRAGLRWISCWQRGGAPIPVSDRKIVVVPSPLTAIILVISVALALLALNFSVQNAFSSSAVAEATADGNDSAAEENEATADENESAAEENETTADGNESADAAATTAAATAAPTAKTTEADSSEAAQRARMMVMQTIGMNVILVAMIGLVVWLKRHDRRDPQADLRQDYQSSRFEWNVGSDEQPAELQLDENPYDPSGSGFAETDGLTAAGPPPLALRQSFSWAEELRVALTVVMAVYLPTMLLRVGLVALMHSVTGKLPDSNPMLEILNTDAGRQMAILIGFAAVVMAPLAEELQFRVVILGGLLQSGSGWLAPLLTAVLFGMAHGIPDGLALLPLAFALGYTYTQRRSYRTVVLVHMLFNLFNVLLALLVLI